MPTDAQLTFLDKTVEAMPEAKPSLDAMVAEWIKGDADALAALLNAELDDPVLYQRLLTQRNANWAGWIEQRLQQPGTVFIAVGAGHLAGATACSASSPSAGSGSSASGSDPAPARAGRRAGAGRLRHR
jgi:uncharacterized protein YbaP (TraB family)